jgi:hypothetical protein
MSSGMVTQCRLVVTDVPEHPAASTFKVYTSQKHCRNNEVATSPETSVTTYQSTRRHITEILKICFSLLMSVTNISGTSTVLQ